MKPKLIYYAHSKAKYGTSCENEEIEYINKKFNNCIVINPNGWIYNCGNESIIMKQCFKLVENSDILVFSTIEDDVIGKGVYTEIKCALNNKHEVYLLKNKQFISLTKDDFNNIEIVYNKTNSWKNYAKVHK